MRLQNNAKQIKPGLILVGSHVRLADDQLDILLKDNFSCVGFEIPVKKVLRAVNGPFPDLLLNDLKKEWTEKISYYLHQKKTPVIYSSRREMKFSSSIERIEFGLYLAELMAEIVGNLLGELGYIISKGGITTQILLAKGFKVNQVDLIGQILPGLSVVNAKVLSLNDEMPVLTFPGNLGDQNTLLNAWKLMEEKAI